MKNKKGFILFSLITIISCFLCISSANAAYSNQATLDYYNFDDFNFQYNNITYTKDSLFSRIRNIAKNNLTRDLSYFEYYFISIPRVPNNSQSNYRYISVTLLPSDFINTTKFIPYRDGSRYYFKTDYKVSFNSGVGIDLLNNNGFFHNGTTNTNSPFSYGSISGTMSPGYNSLNPYDVYTNFPLDLSMISNDSNYPYTVYTNFHIIDVPLNDNYNPYNVNFHLNGGHNIDMSDVLNWQFSYEDYSVSLYNNEIHDYISHLTFIKEKHAFDGLYYDEDFTMPYSPDDTITSDIDLYAKFTSKIYYTNDIDYIEIKFDDLPLAETNISYDYMIRSVYSDGSDNTIDFSQPHGREFYTGCDDDNSNCSPTLRYKDKLFYDMDFIGYYYTHHEDLTFNDDANHITSSYSVIIPLETSIANWIYVDFDCDYDYEIIVHYKNDENDKTSVSNYLETIDITNKYGAIFLPLYDNTAYADEGSYYLTHFKVIGTVDVQVTDSRALTDYNILQLYSMGHCNYSYEKQDNRNDDSDLYIDKSIPYSCDNNTGIFKFKIDHNTAGQTLRFVNVNYSSSVDVPVKITYDTRYFNYGILDTPHSMVDIVDPTTGEVEHVGLNDFYNQLNKNENNKNFKMSLNRFIKPIKFILKYITKIFNNYLSASLQDYFFFVFSLALIILIMRVIF